MVLDYHHTNLDDGLVLTRPPEAVLRGHVIAVDPTLGRLRIRTGPHLFTLTAEPSALDGVRVGQLITASVPLAG
jgi:hypothetical protein